MKKIFRFFLIFIIISKMCYARHVFKESYYQEVWCKTHNGILEYRNEDKTRVDCLTDTHAVEFDFAPKWAEGVGQALYYGMITGRRGMVVLILETPSRDYVYLNRVKFMAKELNFDVDCMSLKTFAESKEQNGHHK